MSAVAPRDVEVRNLQFAPANSESGVRASYPSSLSVCVRLAGKDRRRSAIDVSEEGLFVESPDHLAPGELVQLLVILPDDDRTLRALATVERVVTPDEASFCGGMPGMGLRFFMMDSRLLQRWRAYLEGVARVTLPRTPNPEAVEHRLPEEEARRAQPRKQGRFRVRIADEASLRSFYTDNVSRGGMFLATDDVRALGTRLSLIVRHPVSGRQFPLAAEVRWTRKASDEGPAGMGVQLLGSDTGREEDFLRFINEG